MHGPGDAVELLGRHAPAHELLEHEARVAVEHALRHPGPWEMRLYGFGECLPRSTNHVTLDPDTVDAWGVPALRIHCVWSDNERAALQEIGRAHV